MVKNPAMVYFCDLPLSFIFDMLTQNEVSGPIAQNKVRLIFQTGSSFG